MAWRIQATYESTRNPDFVYSLATIGLISGLELWLGIIVACAPTIPPILKTYVRPAFEKLASYYHSRRGTSRDRRKPSSNPSENIEMHGYSHQSPRNGPFIGASGVTTKVTSLGRIPPFRTASNSGHRGTLHVDPYLVLDDEARLWASGFGHTVFSNQLFI